MTWDIARCGVRCWRCPVLIGAGEPFRHLRCGQLVCPTCAKTLLGEDPPADLPAPSIMQRLAMPETLTRFDREATAAKLRANMHDVRMRQVGEEG